MKENKVNEITEELSGEEIEIEEDLVVEEITPKKTSFPQKTTDQINPRKEVIKKDHVEKSHSSEISDNNLPKEEESKPASESENSNKEKAQEVNSPTNKESTQEKLNLYKTF